MSMNFITTDTEKVYQRYNPSFSPVENRALRSSFCSLQAKYDKAIDDKTFYKNAHHSSVEVMGVLLLCVTTSINAMYGC